MGWNNNILWYYVFFILSVLYWAFVFPKLSAGGYIVVLSLGVFVSSFLYTKLVDFTLTVFYRIGGWQEIKRCIQNEFLISTISGLYTILGFFHFFLVSIYSLFLWVYISILCLFRIVDNWYIFSFNFDFEFWLYVGTYLMLILCLLMSIAYFTLFERQVLAALQRRQGPNIVGFYGLLQPITDGVKLLLKESIIPKSANGLIFLFAPIFTFGLALAGWSVIPLGEGCVMSDFNLSLLYVFMLSSLGVHTIIMAGWSSNSKYAFLGGLRSAAQMISYEISLGAVILSLLVVGRSLNFTDLVVGQKDIWYALPLLPIFILFFICALAETNRHPFDLPEAEAELVSGYNVEYSAVGFVLFFLAEYSNIILISVITIILFLGGWLGFFEFIPFSWVPQTLNSATKTMFIITLFILVRGVLPRYRYDQLMRLGWKVFLPLGLAFFVVFGSLLLTFNISLEFLA